MERREFDLQFRVFANEAHLTPPLRMAILSWACWNWQRIRILSSSQINEFLVLAHSFVENNLDARRAVHSFAGPGATNRLDFESASLVNDLILAAYEEAVHQSEEGERQILSRLLAPLSLGDMDDESLCGPRS